MTTPDPSIPESWLRVTDSGLYCLPGDFYVDPHRPVDRAVITHGHADHARPGHRAVLATQDTLEIMKVRYGAQAGGQLQAAALGAVTTINGVDVGLAPAGHVLGSAQVVLSWQGCRIVVSGDYKRRSDPTCEAFEPVACDVFVTEATFGLPVFRHPSTATEIDKILQARALYPERSVLVGAYALGKAQRVIAELRAAGYERPIYLHGALQRLTDFYVSRGQQLGPLKPATVAAREEMTGEVVLAPPSALADRWSRRLPNPVTAMASGWMRVRARAKQRGVELPIILSDHADWDELTETIEAVGAHEIWVTHGSEEALVHYAASRGLHARALALIGRGEEEQEETQQAPKQAEAPQ